MTIYIYIYFFHIPARAVRIPCQRVLGNAANTAFLAQVYRKDCLSAGSQCLSGGDDLSNDDLLLFSKVFLVLLVSLLSPHAVSLLSQDTDTQTLDTGTAT